MNPSTKSADTPTAAEAPCCDPDCCAPSAAPAARPTAEADCCGSDCCTPASSAKPPAARAPIPTTKTVGPTPLADAERIRAAVREGYGTIAKEGVWTKETVETSGGYCGGGCCGPTTLSPEDVARAVGYADGDLSALPEGANMGLSCGNPTAIAALKPGEVVLDLGAGGGFDCFIAGPKVGAMGKVIGVDMTADMIAKARGNLAAYRAQSGLDNVEFRLGEIENLPVADARVDVVISNCVLNLSPDKPQVWKEIARVLRPGGRVAVSDLALLKPLPESVRADVEALVGCVAGAVLVEETWRMMLAAGLTEIVLTSKPEYIDAMTQWQDPLYQRILAALPTGSKASDYITSLDIAGRKPR